MGFYLFPFEKTYPQLRRRSHEYTDGSTFGSAVKLYYFDYDLRNLLLKYITRIEVKFRTILTYECSMKYRDNPYWFIDPACVTTAFVSDFDRVVYNSTFRKNPTIKRHHKEYKEVRYAPAWKTIELMTLGENVTLYGSLLDVNLKRVIAGRFGIRYVDVFENYIELLRILRNTCAHGSVLFDFRPYARIKRGPANLSSSEEYMNLWGCIKVVKYLLGQVSENREKDMMLEIQAILNRYWSFPEIAGVLNKCGGLPEKV